MGYDVNLYYIISKDGDIYIYIYTHIYIYIYHGDTTGCLMGYSWNISADVIG